MSLIRSRRGRDKQEDIELLKLVGAILEAGLTEKKQRRLKRLRVRVRRLTEAVDQLAFKHPIASICVALFVVSMTLLGVLVVVSPPTGEAHASESGGEAAAPAPSVVPASFPVGRADTVGVVAGSGAPRVTEDQKGRFREDRPDILQDIREAFLEGVQSTRVRLRTSEEWDLFGAWREEIVGEGDTEISLPTLYYLGNDRDGSRAYQLVYGRPFGILRLQKAYGHWNIVGIVELDTQTDREIARRIQILLRWSEPSGPGAP